MTADRPAVLLIWHHRAWAFRKSLHTIPLTDKRLYRPIAYYNLAVGALLAVAWAPVVWWLYTLGAGIFASGLSLVAPAAAYYYVTTREPTGAGVVPTARGWVTTVVAWCAAVAAPRRVTFSVRSGARRVRVRQPRLQRVAAWWMWARHAGFPPVGLKAAGHIDTARLPLVARYTED